VIKKLIARSLGLRTEEDHQLAILDACDKLKHTLEQRHKEEVTNWISAAADLLNQYSLRNRCLLAFLPFLSRNNTFYWIVVEMEQPELGPEGQHYPLCSMWAFDPCSLTFPQGRMYFRISGTHVRIRDIVVSRQREGIGSFFLTTLEQLAKHFGVTKISGWLSPADARNRSAQVAFYTRNGYSVQLSEDKQTGSIEKVLT